MSTLMRLEHDWKADFPTEVTFNMLTLVIAEQPLNALAAMTGRWWCPRSSSQRPPWSDTRRDMQESSGATLSSTATTKESRQADDGIFLKNKQRGKTLLQVDLIGWEKLFERILKSRRDWFSNIVWKLWPWHSCKHNVCKHANHNNNLLCLTSFSSLQIQLHDSTSRPADTGIQLFYWSSCVWGEFYWIRVKTFLVFFI